MEKIGKILKRKLIKNPRTGRPVHAKHEFQEYGLWLSEQLHDKKHKGLYIKLAKEKPRNRLEQARIFATEVESTSVNRGRLFMWKLAELDKRSKKMESTKKQHINTTNTSKNNK